MSIQSQINAAASGATVTIAPGTYPENVTISKPVKLIGGPGVFLKGQAGGWNGIHVDANDVTIDGFDISGAKGDGIEANGQHHITILNCVVHGSGESGIQGNQSDWFRIENCKCYGNAGTGWFSGISLYQQKELATGTLIEGKWRNLIRNCECYNNDTKGGNHTDGNGIIIDDWNNTQGGGQTGGYKHGILVENCCVYGNDGKGVQVTWANNVTVRYVTAYGNDKDAENSGSWRGGISISESTGCTVELCIAEAVRGSGPLANNRAYCDTSQGVKNATRWVNCIGWDAAGTPSIRLDGGNPNPSGIQWVNPQLNKTTWLPGITTDAGWRPAVEPVEPVDPVEPVEPVEPVIPPTGDVDARLAALESAVAVLQEKVSDLNAEVVKQAKFDTEIADEISDQAAFDQDIKDLT
jgi:serralysin